MTTSNNKDEYVLNKGNVFLVASTIFLISIIMLFITGNWWILFYIFLAATIITLLASKKEIESSIKKINKKQLIGIAILSSLFTTFSSLIPPSTDFHRSYRLMFIYTIPQSRPFMHEAWGFPIPFSSGNGFNFDLFFLDILIYFVLILITIKAVKLTFSQDKPEAK